MGASPPLRCLSIVCPCIMVLFFAMPPVITFDTGHYLNYLPILNGDVGFENWDIVRGPIFPVLLNLTCHLLGHNVQGITAVMFLFYITSLFIITVLIEYALAPKKDLTFLYVAILLLLSLNPIIFGGYHTLLTEFPAATAAIFCCLLTWKWYYKSGKLDWRDAAYSAFFVIAAVICWQLKQTYMGCVMYPVIGIVFCSLMRIKLTSIPRVGIQIGTLFACLFAMLISTSLWTNYIDSFGQMNESRTTFSLANQEILSHLPLTYVEDCSVEEALQRYNMPSGQKKAIQKLDNEEICQVYQLDSFITGKTDQHLIIPGASEDRNILNSVSIIMKCFWHYPSATISEYGVYYLKFCNILDSDPQRANYPILEIEYGHGDENGAIYYKPLYSAENVFYVSDELRSAVAPFHSEYTTPFFLKHILRLSTFFADFSFKLMMSISPVIWLVIVVLLMRNRKDTHKAKVLTAHFILWTYCFGNFALNLLMFLPIDRYLFTGYFTAIASVMLFIMETIQNRFQLKNEVVME